MSISAANSAICENVVAVASANRRGEFLCRPPAPLEEDRVHAPKSIPENRPQTSAPAENNHPHPSAQSSFRKCSIQSGAKVGSEFAFVILFLETP
jgi:hypothetical protein